MIDVDFIIRLEDGECSVEEVVEGIQPMINDESVWQLQGFYGRLANDLINQGLCHA